MHPLKHKYMNGYGDDTSSSCCYFHPEEVVIGVCPICLNERLLILASKQGHHHCCSSVHRSRVAVSDKKKKPNNISNLLKIFALGSLLNRFEFPHWKADISDQHDACSSSSSRSSQEDSFISIKFEDNGVASWEKGTVSKASHEQCSMSPWSNKNNTNNNNNNNNNNSKSIPEESQSVIEHGKEHSTMLRWRKRIRQLLRLVRGKARSKGKGNMEGVKVRKRLDKNSDKERKGQRIKGVV